VTNSSDHDPRVAVYALTRGYSGINKIRYYFVIRRNFALQKMIPKDMSADLLLFHEGNMSKFDQWLVQALSHTLIQYVDVSTIFKADPNQSVEGLSRKELGYSLMCRFHYRDVWNLLQGYDVVYRVDEDCVVESFPILQDDQDFVTGFISDEAHDLTNQTLPKFLETLDLGEYYDHKFPYTNFFVTRTRIWQAPEVQSILYVIGSHPNALTWRWGDLPIIGVILKAFYNWDAMKEDQQRIRYKHLSHNVSVAEGKALTMKRHILIKILRKINKVIS
jgi:hypothetical protein